MAQVLPEPMHRSLLARVGARQEITVLNWCAGSETREVGDFSTSLVRSAPQTSESEALLEALNLLQFREEVCDD